MSNKSELYRKGYNFEVYLEGNRVPFKKVSGFSDEGRTEALREGGRNTVIYSLFQPRTEERVVTLERGLLADEMEFESYKPGYQFRSEISIFVLGDDGSIVKEYYLQGCWIRKISIDDLDASSSNLVSATIEIVYQTLEEG